MFCHKCGYKLTNNSSQCSNCGTTQRTLEVCGGFWGLVGEEKRQVQNVTPSVSQPNANVVDTKVVEKFNNLEYMVNTTAKKQMTLTYISYGIMFLIVVVLMVSNIFLLSKIDKANENNVQLASDSVEETQPISQAEDEKMTVEPTTKITEATTELKETSTTEEVTTEETTEENTSEETTTEESTTEEQTTEDVTTEEPTTEAESTSDVGVKGV